MTYLGLIAMLLLILLAAEVFTNALEHLGERLKISEGVTGSLFAAVGTALPETMVPLLAIFAGTDSQHVNEEIGVGAILGAPLMLSTLTMALMASVVVAKRGLQGHFNPEHTGLARDLNTFIFAFVLATIVLFVPHELAWLRATFAIVLVLSYFIYIMVTLKASEKLVKDGHATEAQGTMMLSKLGLPTNDVTIGLQLLLGLGLLVGGAKGFIHYIEIVSQIWGISALILSLLIVPIATELPEKVNSVLWIRRHKDTLAFGNITGAMVFQGTLLPAIGIMLTPWDPRTEVLAGAVITLASALWLRALLMRGQLRVWHLLCNSLLYVAYLVIAFGFSG
jgi:cation:H+ antiporter